MSESGEGLRQLRQRYLLFWAAFAVIAIVVVVIAPRDGVTPGWLYGIIVLGVATVVAQRFELKLVTTDADALAESYKARLYLRICVAEPILLVGLIGALKSGPWWLYFVALAFASIPALRGAPTDAAIARDQARLDAAGCTLDLASALEQMPVRKRG